MIKFTIAFVGFLFALPIDSGVAETLTFAAQEKLAPYSWDDHGKARGINIEITQEAAKRAGFAVEFITSPFKRVLYGVKWGDVDGGLGVFRTAEREEYSDYTSIPLITVRVHAFTVKESSFRYKNVESLYGYNVGKIRGFSMGKSLETAKKNAKFEVTELNTVDSAIKMLARQRIDIIVNDYVTILYRAKQLSLSEAIQMQPIPVLPGEGVYLIFSKAKLGTRSKEITDKFNLALQSMDDDGTMQAIINRHLK